MLRILDGPSFQRFPGSAEHFRAYAAWTAPEYGAPRAECRKVCLGQPECGDILDFPLHFTGERDITDAVLTITDVMSEVSGTQAMSRGSATVNGRPARGA